MYEILTGPNNIGGPTFPTEFKLGGCEAGVTMVIFH